MGYQLSRPAGEVLHGVRKFFDRLFGVTIFNAFLDTMLQMPFQNNLSHTMYRALYCVDLISSQGTSSSTILSIAFT